MRRTPVSEETPLSDPLLWDTDPDRDPGQGVSVRDFVKVEKNLSSMGFFTPSKSRGRVEVREKVMTFRREAEGKVVETTATILPSAKYGLPTTADQDKFFAFQKIVNDRRQRQGRVENPIGFTSKELLDILGIQDAGNNYQEIYEWLQRMTLTGIHSRGVVYLAGKKVWASDTFHVFERAVAYGMEIGSGQVADRNYIWLSDWQLDNINNNHLMPVDLETYRRLRGNIAKALVPLLQIWLYASRSEGVFEKRYDDLCVILDIRFQTHLSQIRKQLGPSLDELVEHGYLSSWVIEPTLDGRSYKVTAEHGPKFFQDQRHRLLRRTRVVPAVPEERNLLQELIDRGVGERQARHLLRSLPEEQPVRAQLAWIDHILVTAGKRIQNPPGFYISLLRDNVRVPEGFGKRAPVPEERDVELVERMEQEDRYKRYQRDQVQAFIDGQMGAEEFRAQVEERQRAGRRVYGNLPVETQREIAEGLLRRDIEKRISLLSFTEFLKNSPRDLFS